MKSPIQVVIDIKNSSRINLGNVAIRDTTNIEITLIDNSIPVKFTSPVFELHIKKYDGNFIRQKDGIEFVDNKVSIKLWDQANVYPGIVYCELLIKDGGRSTTSKFYFVCKKTLDSEIIESIRDVETLDNLDSWLEQSNLELEKFKLYVETLTNNNVDLESLVEIKDFMSINLEALKFQNIKASKNNEILIVKNNEAEEKIIELDKRDLSLVEIKEENIKASINTTNLDRENTEATTNISNLDSKNNAATNNVKNLDSKNTLASTNIKDLDSKNSTAADNITKLATKNTDAATNLENLNVSIEEAKEIKIATDEIIASGSAVTVTKFKEEIDKTNTQLEEINTEVTDASVDFLGEAHNNLQERIIKDVGDIHDRINNAEIMELEGSGLSAKTFAGYTKEMEIKGKTWQNIVPKNYKINWSHSGTWLSHFLVSANAPDDINYTKINIDIKPNTTYTIVCNIAKNTSSGTVYLHKVESKTCYFDSSISIKPTDIGIVKFTKTSIADFSLLQEESKRVVLRAQSSGATSGEVAIEDIMILEGDYTNKPIPDYFEGIQSTGEAEMVGSKYKVEVESRGKNLCNYDNALLSCYSLGVPYTSTYTDGITIVGETINIATRVDRWNDGVGFYVKVDKNKKYIFSVENFATDAPGMELKALGLYSHELPMEQFSALVNFKDRTTGCKLVNGIRSHTAESGDYDYILFTVMGYWVEGMKGVKNHSVSGLMICEYDVATPYEPYKKDNTHYLLDEPLRSLPGGVEDTINPQGILTRRIGKVVLDGFNEDSWRIMNQEKSWDGETTTSFRTYMPHEGIETPNNSKVSIITDTISASSANSMLGNKETKSVCVHSNKVLIFRVENDKIIDKSVSSGKKWLQSNPITVFYELAEPIITELKKKPILRVYDGLTYINSTNSIKADLVVKLPVNVNAMLQDTIKENKLLKDNVQALEIENREVNEKQNSSLNILSDMDTNLVSTSWDMDFRLMEVEFFVEDNLPKQISTDNKIKNNRGGNVMALSRFEQAKIMILGGVYVRETLEYQLNVYLKRGYMTKEEVDELIAMMDARELVEGE